MLHNYGCEQPNFSSGLLQMFLHANGVFIAKEKTQRGQETLLENKPKNGLGRDQQDLSKCNKMFKGNFLFKSTRSI